MAVAGAATALSIASIGLSAAGQYTQAEGTSAADQYKAEQLDAAAQSGELKAVQTNAQMTRNLSMTLGNIDAVRAGSHADPASPTGAVVRDYVENIGAEQKNFTVDNITRQAQMDESNAQYLREAGNTAMLGGDLGIVGTILKGAAGLPGIGR